MNGLKDASTDAEAIKRWWSMWADANIGILTGAASFIALDVDPIHGGNDSLDELTHKHGDLPETVEAITGSGGRHILLQHPGFELRNRTGVRLGLDIRGDGGYIVGTPSLHQSGRRYEWELSSGPHQVALAPMPGWLVSLVQGPSNGAAKSSEEWRSIVCQPIPEGQRNDALARLIGHLLRRYVDPDIALTLALSWNAQNCRPPLDEHEVLRTFDSIAAKEAARRLLPALTAGGVRIGL